jgi:hypothetical protein
MARNIEEVSKGVADIATGIISVSQNTDDTSSSPNGVLRFQVISPGRQHPCRKVCTARPSEMCKERG